MGELLVYRDVLEAMTEGSVLLGEKDYIRDEKTQKFYDLAFHTKQAEAERFEGIATLIIPVMQGTGNKDMDLERVLQAYANTRQERYMIKDLEPQLYEIEIKGEVPVVHKKKFAIISREETYKKQGFKKEIEEKKRILDMTQPISYDKQA